MARLSYRFTIIRLGLHEYDQPDLIDFSHIVIQPLEERDLTDASAHQVVRAHVDAQHVRLAEEPPLTRRSQRLPVLLPPWVRETRAATAPIVTCFRCNHAVQSLLRQCQIFWDVSSGEHCVCGRGIRSGTDLLLQVALLVATESSILVLGGSPALDAAIGKIDCRNIHLIREKHRTDTSIVSSVDIIVLALGLTKHKNTLPFTRAHKKLPKAQRPPLLAAKSASPAGVAEALLQHCRREQELLRAS